MKKQTKMEGDKLSERESAAIIAIGTISLYIIVLIVIMLSDLLR